MTHTIAVGDIHGEITKLNHLLNGIASLGLTGTLVFLGDYCDRGPDTPAVIERLMGLDVPGWRCICLSGNHERMLLNALNGIEEDLWLKNGGAVTYISYSYDVPENHKRWLRSLPFMHEDQHRIFAHASYDETLPSNEQTEQTLLCDRLPDGYSGEYRGKHLVHGHTPSHKNPRTIGNRTNLDSGACFDGFLSSAVFNNTVPGAPHIFLKASNSGFEIVESNEFPYKMNL